MSYLSFAARTPLPGAAPRIGGKSLPRRLILTVRLPGSVWRTGFERAPEIEFLAEFRFAGNYGYVELRLTRRRSGTEQECGLAKSAEQSNVRNLGNLPVVPKANHRRMQYAQSFKR